MVFFFKPLNFAKSTVSPKSSTVNTPTTSPLKKYVDKELGFSFQYPAGFEVFPDNEEKYFQRSGGDLRKNFTSYVGYEPPKFIAAWVVMKDGDQLKDQFDSEPFAVWVFDNSQKYSTDRWFEDYWYYPFVWGIFVPAQKAHIAPDKIATVSGKLTKSVVISYQPGQPQFIYLSANEKMFMFKIVDKDKSGVGQKILSSFKLD